VYFIHHVSVLVQQKLNNNPPFQIANAILNNNDAKLTELLRTVDVIIFPVVNPDGYQYTRTDPSLVEYRMWRKNRSPQVCQELNSGEMKCCRGVDLNRNFAFKFAG
jgi:murein tripeptide amidase MpaA